MFTKTFRRPGEGGFTEEITVHTPNVARVPTRYPPYTRVPPDEKK